MSNFSNNYYCSCDNCYCSDFKPDRFFPCAKGARKRIEYENKERHREIDRLRLIKKEKRLRLIKKEERLRLIKKEEEDFIKRKKLEIKIREEKKEKDRKKKRFYEFWYYSLIFILTYEIFKGLIIYKLSTID